MTMSNISEDLIRFGFEGEEGLSQEFIDKYAVSYPKNKIIFQEGDKSDKVYYILAGGVYVTKKMHDSFKIITIVGKGDLFGEMGIFEDTTRSATIIAKEETRLLIFTRDQFIDILKIHPRWIDKILQDLSERIIELAQKL